MPTTPVKNGRLVLLPLPNGTDKSPVPHISMKPDNSTAPSSPNRSSRQKPNTLEPPFVNRQRPKLISTLSDRRASVSSFAKPPPAHPSSPSLRRASIAAPARIPPSPVLRRPSISNLAKRARASPHNKRVSFGGDTITIINQHKNEFKSPGTDSPQDSSSRESSPRVPGVSQSSPPRKAVKSTFLSSPSVRTSPTFAERHCDLVLNDDEDCDDTITITEPSQFESRPPPRIEGRSTPVPIKRNSISIARQSFGVFLDDQFDAGKEPGMHFGLNGDDGQDNTRTNMLVSDSVRTDSSDGDVTRNLENFGLSGLMECDESAAIDDERLYTAPQHVVPSPSNVPGGSSSFSSRNSLAYVADNVLFRDTDEGHKMDGRTRVSLAPIGHERRADFGIDDSPDNLSVDENMPPIGNLIDQVKFDEDEENNASNVHVSSPGSAQLEVGSDVKPIVRSVLPESRKLFDTDTTEEETIHYHDEQPIFPQQKSQTRSTERDILVTTAKGIEENRSHDQRILSASRPPKLPTVQPGLSTTMMNRERRTDLSARATPEELNSSVDGDAKEESTAPLEIDNSGGEVRQEPASSSSPTQPNASQALSDEAKRRDDDADLSTPRAAMERTTPFCDSASSKHSASPQNDQKGGEILRQPPSSSHASQLYATHESSDRVHRRGNGIALSTPLLTMGRAALVASGDNESMSSAVRQTTPQSMTGSKIRATLTERAFGSRRGDADSQFKELASSVSKAPKTSVALGQEVVLSESTFSVSDFLDECNVHFDKTFVVDQREASIVVSQTEELDRSTLAIRLTESVKRIGVLQRLQEEVVRQAELVRNTERSIEAIENELVNIMPPVFAMMSRSDTVSMKEMTNCRVGMKRLRKVSALRARLNWVQSRQTWENSIRKHVEQVVEGGKHHIAHLESSDDSYGKLYSKFKESVRNSGLDVDANETDDSVTLAAHRKDLSDEFSYITELKNLISSTEDSEEELTQRKLFLTQRKKDTSISVANLESYVGAMTDNKLQDKVTERLELNTLMCRIAGLHLRQIGLSGVSATIADLMHVNVKFDGDDITEVVANPVVLQDDNNGVLKQRKTCKSVVQSFVDGAVSMCDLREDLKKVRDLPFVLHRSAEKLLFAKNFLLTLSEYFDMHLGYLTAARVVEVENAVDTTLVASFHSLTKWTKFDICLTVSTLLPRRSGGPYQELKDITVTRFIGTLPANDTLDTTIREGGFRKTQQAFDIKDAFALIWKLIE